MARSFKSLSFISAPACRLEGLRTLHTHGASLGGCDTLVFCVGSLRGYSHKNHRGSFGLVVRQSQCIGSSDLYTALRG